MSSLPPASSNFGLSEIAQVSVNVHDVDAAVAFYRDTLGMQYLFSAPNMAFFQCGSVRLMLAVPESPEFDHRASIIYYRVDNIDHAFHTLRERGVAFRGDPQCVHRTEKSELWMAFFQDPDDNVLCLVNEEERQT